MTKAAERSAARLAAVQALYQMDVAGKGVVDATAEFEAFWIGREVEGLQFAQAENAFFRQLLAGTVEHQMAVDRQVDAALSDGWPLKRVEAVLRAILRAGAYELAFRKDVPAKVVISEYVEVARDFYDDDEPKLVNGVLDAVARLARPGELKERGAPGSKPGAAVFPPGSGAPVAPGGLGTKPGHPGVKPVRLGAKPGGNPAKG